ncbi:unnamed protein product [Diplocarpon coronariae]|uniref:Uncharacterized protein n=1 Tax=Diplocarpon coronariae TaxID=2795749 RepID=A0A218ZDX0_9HELO|nr:hypothetical protein B2J93_7819 [Marssonina coronariae]
MSEVKKGTWTDAENYQMVFQILSQVLAESKITVKSDQLNLPNRTPRAISDHWLVLKKMVAAPTTGGGSAIKTPKKAAGSKTATPASKRKANNGTDGDATTPTPKRRKSPLKKKLSKNEEEVAAEDSEEMPVLTDSSGSDGMVPSPADSYRSYEHYT